MSRPRGGPPTSQRRLLRIAGAALAALAIISFLRWVSDGAGGPRVTRSDQKAAAPLPAQDAAGAAQPPAVDATGAVAAASTSDAEFAARLAHLSVRRAFEGTRYAREIAGLVDAARIADAAKLLESRAVGGDRDATVALAQLSGLCQSHTLATGWREAYGALHRQLEAEQARSAPVPAELARRIDVILAFDEELFARTVRACSEARFAAQVIDQRLRDAAQAGHEASLWVLGGRAEDAELRKKYWLSAAMLGHPQSQVGLARSLLAENLRGDRRNRGQMNFWLEVAARHSPGARLGLGECLLNGCNAQPPDSEAAVPLLREAAALGEPGAFQALASISRTDPAALPDEELYALQSFLQQLNQAGCYGASLYASTALEGLRSSREIASRLSPHGLAQAQELAAAIWRDHGESARRAQGCD